MYIFDIHTRESKILAVLNISVSDFFFSNDKPYYCILDLVLSFFMTTI